MRYGIVEHHEDGPESPVPYFVVDSAAPSERAGMLGPKFSKAEASICAFGLSGIAEGYMLVVLETSQLGDLFTRGVSVVAYDGPTDGVLSDPDKPEIKP